MIYSWSTSAQQNHKYHSQIRKQCNIQDIVKWARTRLPCWSYHLGRMDNNRIANMEMVQKPRNRRPPGDHQKDGRKVGCHHLKKILIRQQVSNIELYSKLKERKRNVFKHV